MTRGSRGGGHRNNKGREWTSKVDKVVKSPMSFPRPWLCVYQSRIDRDFSFLVFHILNSKIVVEYTIQ